MEFNRFYRLRVQYRQLNEDISLYTDSEKLYEFLEELRANPNPPYQYTEEAIQVFLEIWEFQHKNRIQKYRNTRIIVPNIVPTGEELEKSIVVYTPEMCEVFATSILQMIRLYDHEKTKEKLIPIIAEVGSIARNAILSRSPLEHRLEFNPKNEFKRLRNFQTRAIAIIGHQREIDFE